MDALQVVYGLLLLAVGGGATILWWQFRGHSSEIKSLADKVAAHSTTLAAQEARMTAMADKISGLPDSENLRKIVKETLEPIQRAIDTGFGHVEKSLDEVKKDLREVDVRLLDIEKHGTPKSREISQQQQQLVRQLAKRDKT